MWPWLYETYASSQRCGGDWTPAAQITTRTAPITAQAVPITARAAPIPTRAAPITARVATKIIYKTRQTVKFL